MLTHLSSAPNIFGSWSYSDLIPGGGGEAVWLPVHLPVLPALTPGGHLSGTAF